VAGDGELRELEGSAGALTFTILWKLYTEKELAEPGGGIFDLEARCESVLLLRVNFGLKRFHHQFEALADHLRKPRRPDVEIDCVYERIEWRFVAVSLKCGIAEIDENE
jgi:hypothetical protein